MLAPIVVAQVLYAAIKKTLSVSAPYLLHSNWMSKLELGIISTNFSLAYGFSKLIGGILSDLFRPQLLFELGLVMGSAVNIIIAVVTPDGIQRSLFSIGNLWLLNGIAQGIGGPALNKMLVETFEPTSRGTAVSVATFVSHSPRTHSHLTLLSRPVTWATCLVHFCCCHC